MEDSTEEEESQWMMLGELCERKSIGERLLKEAGEMWQLGNEFAGKLKEIARVRLIPVSPTYLNRPTRKCNQWT